jgi:FAD synthetase
MKNVTLVKTSNIDRVTDAIRRYLQDARHYLDQGRATTSLASVAYAEGLLDALKFLELTQPRIVQLGI